MRIIIFDRFHLFKENEIKRLSAIGIKEILTFDYWCENEPTKGEYNFSRLIEYERTCQKLGIKLLIMGPVVAPLWAPKEWFLKNAEGLTNDFQNESSVVVKKLLEKIKTGENIEEDLESYENMRFFSYWNPEAENYLCNYIKKFQKILKYSEHLNNIGQWGEDFFPTTWIFCKPEKSYWGPWWYDEYAKKSWQDSGLDREGWLTREFLRITRKRLKLYKTKWLQYIWLDHDLETQKKLLGNMAVKEAFEEHKEGLNILRFEIFVSFVGMRAVAKMAKKYRIFVGAEGCKNILPNYLRAKKIGLAGLICNLSTPHLYAPIQEKQYKRLEMTMQMDKGGIKSFGTHLLAYILKLRSDAIFSIKETDRCIGLFGIFLKKHSPKFYKCLKSIKKY